MSAFQVHRDYPLAKILDESTGYWIIPGVVKGLSHSEAVLLLRLSEKGRSEVVFPSSQVCLVHFYCDNAWSEIETIDQRLRSITKLWVFVAAEQVATLIRVVPRPLSFIFSLKFRSTLTIPLEPPLSPAEWDRLGLKHVAAVLINDNERRYVGSELDAEELCRHLSLLPSFWLHATRVEGGELDVSRDANGIVADYADMKRGIKLISLNPNSTRKEIVRQRIEALPYMELETERRHLIPIERGLHILRIFLSTGKPVEMVPWPLDN